METRVRSMLVWLIMAALCGAIGFGIIYYYSTNARPMERFAIVIDAGSTQTRSNLFKISIDPENFDDLSAAAASSGNSQQDDGEGNPIAAGTSPLGELIKVQQVSSCVNGGPMAALTSEHAAQNLIKKCLVKFSNHIKKLDFIDNQSGRLQEDSGENQVSAGGGESMDADEVSKQMALINHRVNSITHLHLGATAGMRALEQLNADKAAEKLVWMRRAISESNSLLDDNSPYINTGYVGILDGSDEASFGWLSVNFVCDALNASASAPDTLSSTSQQFQVVQGTTNAVVYQLTNQANDSSLVSHHHPANTPEPHSVGTLELGGASAQMAFQVTNNLLGSAQIKNMSIEEQQLNLFDGHYKLATRSDLCLGMSQAVLRLNYVLLHKTMSLSSSSSSSNSHSPVLKLTNACMQKGALSKLTGDQLATLWQGACLVANERLSPQVVQRDRELRLRVTSKKSIELLGSGDVDQCNQLLSNLIEPESCQRYFSLCPSSKNKVPPPSDMPFVTISGYNHALNVLELSPNVVAGIVQPPPASGRMSQFNSIIDDKLGGASISYQNFLEKTQEFCSTPTSELLKRYPKTNKQYQDIICLQLIYIRKLLTEFYLFDPLTSWSQIKFLIFTPKSVPEQYRKVQKLGSSSDMKPDIGWTLGLLLNATSEQLSSTDPNEMYYHHGATVMYMLRTTILVVLACFLIAIALLVVGIVEVRLAQARGQAYISHSSSRTSYDISTLSEIFRKDFQHINIST